jgi:hypothetical protein
MWGLLILAMVDRLFFFAVARARECVREWWSGDCVCARECCVRMGCTSHDASNVRQVRRVDGVYRFVYGLDIFLPVYPASVLGPRALTVQWFVFPLWQRRPLAVNCRAVVGCDAELTRPDGTSHARTVSVRCFSRCRWRMWGIWSPRAGLVCLSAMQCFSRQEYLGSEWWTGGDAPDGSIATKKVWVRSIFS